MNLLLDPVDAAFRDKVRSYLAENVPGTVKRAVDLTTALIVDREIAFEAHRALYRVGWSVPNWPVEYGGTDWSPVQRYLFDCECAKVGATIYNTPGSCFVGPAIIQYGTSEQQQKYLPGIRSGEDYWTQGYSEPVAGSDLASLKTKAESDGEEYVVNGQKIWTSNAHKSNRIFALVRTSNAGKPQEGISFLLIDMDIPGITVRPIIGNGGDHELNEVFFNDVRVPKTNRLGEENQGWQIAKYVLEFERGGRVMAGQVRAQFARIVRLARTRCSDDFEILQRIGEVGSDLDAMEMIAISVLSELQTGAAPGPISSLLNLRWSQIRQSIAELAMDVAGQDSLEWTGSRPLYEGLQLPPEQEELLAIMPRYLNSRGYTIMGGTSEVQTNILAKSLVGL